MSFLAPSSMSAIYGCDLVSMRVTSWNWVHTCSVSGWAKIVRMIDATIGPVVFGTAVSTFHMKWTRQTLPARRGETVSVAATKPVWASLITSFTPPRGLRRAQAALRRLLPHADLDRRLTERLGQIRDLCLELLLARRRPGLAGRAMSGSSPLVGSSKMYSSAGTANAAMSAAFCRLPFEHVRPFLRDRTEIPR